MKILNTVFLKNQFYILHNFMYASTEWFGLIFGLHHKISPFLDTCYVYDSQL